MMTCMYFMYDQQEKRIVIPGYDGCSAYNNIPRDVLILDSLIKFKEGARNEAFHSYMIDNDEDTNI